MLAEMASAESDNVHYEDDSTMADLLADLSLDDEAAETPEWYVGPGYYDASTDERFFDPSNDNGYHYDVMSYRIEEQSEDQPEDGLNGGDD